MESAENFHDMSVAAKRHDNLREACVKQAFAIVNENGVEHLSLREVARRLGVSHQAPYKHFPSRDHILAEVASRAYSHFSKCLENRPRSDDPREDLHSMGTTYMKYAFENPLLYRFMFGTELPDPDEHPEMLRNAEYAFSLLQSGVNAVHDQIDGPGRHKTTDYDALFIWSTLHGLVGNLQSQAIHTIDVPKYVLKNARKEVMERVSRAVFDHR